MKQVLTVEDIGFGPCICAFLDGVPVDDAIRDEGHEPNGYFWQGSPSSFEATCSQTWSSTARAPCSSFTATRRS